MLQLKKMEIGKAKSKDRHLMATYLLGHKFSFKGAGLCDYAI